jgi:hypothetical protein
VVDVKDCTNTTLTGTVKISVTVVTPGAPLVGPPQVGLTNPPSGENAVFLKEEPAGTYHYEWTVTPSTPNGTWTVTGTATDTVSNRGERPFVLCVNRTQLRGQVELEGFAGTNRVVTFVATGGANVKTWHLPLHFIGAVADYVLTDVPAGTTHLSAKSAWHLRVRRPVPPFDAHGVSEVHFLSDGLGGWDATTDHYLRGGDLDGDNLIYTIDYGILGAGWSNAPGPLRAQADITGEGVVGLQDFGLMSANWGSMGDPQ